MWTPLINTLAQVPGLLHQFRDTFPTDRIACELAQLTRKIEQDWGIYLTSWIRAPMSHYAVQ